MPQTLVHNDFKIKNVRVRFGSAGLELLPFDWEVAGWGVPAADLAQFSGNVLSPNLEVYASLVRQVWPHLDLHDIRQMAHLGLVFRCLAAIRWEACSLAGDCVERAIRNMQIYQAGLSELAELAGCGS
jgi:aminoglycoside phosphotransferase (APT) family kinase protein